MALARAGRCIVWMPNLVEHRKVQCIRTDGYLQMEQLMDGQCRPGTVDQYGRHTVDIDLMFLHQLSELGKATGCVNSLHLG
jgi:hypothetical protein